jgi:hypothetical protein
VEAPPRPARRRHHGQVAGLFGLSRLIRYRAAQAGFEREGLIGPLRLVEQHQRVGAPPQARFLAALVQSTLGVRVHPHGASFGSFTSLFSLDWCIYWLSHSAGIKDFEPKIQPFRWRP